MGAHNRIFCQPKYRQVGQLLEVLQLCKWTYLVLSHIKFTQICAYKKLPSHDWHSKSFHSQYFTSSSVEILLLLHVTHHVIQNNDIYIYTSFTLNLILPHFLIDEWLVPMLNNHIHLYKTAQQSNEGIQYWELWPQQWCQVLVLHNLYYYMHTEKFMIITIQIIHLVCT